MCQVSSAEAQSLSSVQIVSKLVWYCPDSYFQVFISFKTMDKSRANSLKGKPVTIYTWCGVWLSETNLSKHVENVL